MKLLFATFRACARDANKPGMPRPTDMAITSIAWSRQNGSCTAEQQGSLALLDIHDRLDPSVRSVKARYATSKQAMCQAVSLLDQ
jgi:hypothetical protein